jgi:hypothetical protein
MAYDFSASLLAAFTKKLTGYLTSSSLKTVNGNDLVGAGNLVIPALPSPSGNTSKYLTSDGTNIVWSSPRSPSVGGFSLNVSTAVALNATVSLPFKVFGEGNVSISAGTTQIPTVAGSTYFILLDDLAFQTAVSNGYVTFSIRSNNSVVLSMIEVGGNFGSSNAYAESCSIIHKPSVNGYINITATATTGACTVTATHLKVIEITSGFSII